MNAKKSKLSKLGQDWTPIVWAKGDTIHVATDKAKRNTLELWIRAGGREWMACEWVVDKDFVDDDGVPHDISCSPDLPNGPLEYQVRADKKLDMTVEVTQ